MSKYINIDDFLQADYPTTFIIGARGVGKTISSITQSIKRCYKNKTKFIYLRRYQTEIDTLGLNLPLIRKLTNLDVEIDNIKDDSGRTAKMIAVNDGDTKVGLGYLLALSVAGKYKSNDYSHTDLIIYDEFIDQRGRELKGETNLFLNFAMTVFRDFTKYKVLFLANATNPFNCYFIDFNVMPKGKVTKFKNLGIKIVMYKTSDELSRRNTTFLAKQVDLIEGSNGSSLANIFSDLVDLSFIKKNKSNAKCTALLYLGGVIYGLWENKTYCEISSSYDKNAKSKYTMNDLKDGFIFDPIFIHSLKNMLYTNRLYFDSITTRGIFIKFLKYGEEVS